MGTGRLGYPQPTIYTKVVIGRYDFFFESFFLDTIYRRYKKKKHNFDKLGLISIKLRAAIFKKGKKKNIFFRPIFL
jgi:hypothetical protein